MRTTGYHNPRKVLLTVCAGWPVGIALIGLGVVLRLPASSRNDPPGAHQSRVLRYHTRAILVSIAQAELTPQMLLLLSSVSCYQYCFQA